MTPWSDPLIVGAGLLALIFLIRGIQALALDVRRRREGRLLDQKDVRILMADYRARFGPREIPARLAADLEDARVRLDGLAARWKDCQRRTEEAVNRTEARMMADEERRAYQAFLAEARRMKLLKRAEERLRA